MLKDRIQLGNDQVLGLRSGYYKPTSRDPRRRGWFNQAKEKLANEVCRLNQVKPLNGPGRIPDHLRGYCRRF